jgi:hypothetical protein
MLELLVPIQVFFGRLRQIFPPVFTLIFSALSPSEKSDVQFAEGEREN